MGAHLPIVPLPMSAFTMTARLRWVSLTVSLMRIPKSTFTHTTPRWLHGSNCYGVLVPGVGREHTCQTACPVGNPRRRDRVPRSPSE